MKTIEENLLIKLTAMRTRISIIAALIFSIVLTASAQDGTENVREMKIEGEGVTVRKLITHQYDYYKNDKDKEQYQKEQERKAIAFDQLKASTSSGTIEDKPETYEYTLDPENGYRYREKVVIEMSDYTIEELARGLVTNTLDRESRYILVDTLSDEISIPALAASITNSEGISLLIDNKKAASSAIKYELPKMPENTIFSAISYNEYALIITKDREYKYIDYRPLVGNENQVERFKDGKPITQNTFYYMAVDADLLNPNVTSLGDFIRMTISEQIQLLASSDATSSL